MTGTIPTTLPIGLVRDLEAALARPGVWVIKIVLRRDGGARVLDQSQVPPRAGDDRPPCPGCAAPMSRHGDGRLRCRPCGITRRPREYQRLARMISGLVESPRHGGKVVTAQPGDDPDSPVLIFSGTRAEAASFVTALNREARRRSCPPS